MTSTRVQLCVAELDLAGAGQEYAEADGGGMAGDLRGDLLLGPVVAAADGGEVITRVVARVVAWI